MPWNKSLSSLTDEIEKDLDDSNKALAFEAERDLSSNTPVGNPSLWKVPYAPRGYVGGSLKQSWETEKRGDNWVVFSRLPYAEAIWDDGHSRRLYQGRTGAVDVVLDRLRRFEGA